MEVKYFNIELITTHLKYIKSHFVCLLVIEPITVQVDGKVCCLKLVVESLKQDPHEEFPIELELDTMLTS